MFQDSNRACGPQLVLCPVDLLRSIRPVSGGFPLRQFGRSTAARAASVKMGRERERVGGSRKRRRQGIENVK